jgi:hypothetical protein
VAILLLPDASNALRTLSLKPTFRPFILVAVRFACKNTARQTICQLGRGIRSLNVIAVTASMLGAVALLEGARQALIGWPPPSYGDVTGGWSEMFVPFAISIATASVATASYGILSAMIEGLRAETEIAILQLLNDLVRPTTNI